MKEKVIQKFKNFYWKFCDLYSIYYILKNFQILLSLLYFHIECLNLDDYNTLRKTKIYAVAKEMTHP